jgi:hypothetical protein
VIDVQEQTPAQPAQFEQQRDSARFRPLLVRNSRFLVGITVLASAVAFLLSIWMSWMACTYLFPLRSLTFDRFAAASLLSLGAWFMALSYVFLFRQGRILGYCSVLLDSIGVYFRLGGASNSREVFLPWHGIAAVHHKRIPEGQRFTVLGTDTSTVTFTSNCFYRPRKVARLIAERAGLPILRG